MQEYLRVSLVFDGATAANGVIDFYDVQRALHGFQRTLALVTHLVLNDEIITQAPSLKNAEILAIPPELGSWKFTAIIVTGLGTGMYTLGTASTDTPVGYVVSSLLDYTLNKTFGIELDYKKSIRELINERDMPTGTVPTPERLNSLAEKTQNSIIEMHRPIEKGSARSASIKAVRSGGFVSVGPDMNRATLAAAREIVEGDQVVEILGRISSYNMNTHSGRIYLPAERRTIPFQLSKDSVSRRIDRAISQSLDENVGGMPGDEGNILLEGIFSKTKGGDISRIIAINARKILKEN